MTESKPADVFAFSMLAVGVLTGEVPSKEQENETAVLRVLEGGRPEMPGNAQAIGLTREMWELLERCWQVDPKKRPTMEEVVRKWGKFVGRDHNDDGTTTECVQATGYRLLLFLSLLGNHNLRLGWHRAPVDLGSNPGLPNHERGPRLDGFGRNGFADCFSLCHRTGHDRPFVYLAFFCRPSVPSCNLECSAFGSSKISLTTLQVPAQRPPGNPDSVSTLPVSVSPVSQDLYS